MKLAEILSGPETWCQGVSKDGKRLCLFEALGRLDGPIMSETARLARLIWESYGRGWSVVLWNDSPDRTWEEVAAIVEAYDRDRMLNPIEVYDH